MNEYNKYDELNDKGFNEKHHKLARNIMLVFKCVVTAIIITLIIIAVLRNCK
jgi:hypothetical protein